MFTQPASRAFATCGLCSILLYNKSFEMKQSCCKLLRDICARYSEKRFTQYIRLCMETLCWCLFEGHKYGRRKPTETAVLECFCKCVNSSLDELIKVKVTFILRQGMLRYQNLWKLLTFSTHIKSFPSLQSPLAQNEEPFRTKNFVWIKKVLSYCNNLWK